MSANILDGKQIAKDIVDDVSEKVSELKLSGWCPKLISIKVGTNPAVDLYIRNQRLKAEQVGIIFEEKEYPDDISANELQAAIANFNVGTHKLPASFYSDLFRKAFPLKLCRKPFILSKTWKECTLRLLETSSTMNWNLDHALPWLQ